MDIRDLVVEVRDGSLARHGAIDQQYLVDAIFSPARNDVGGWQLRLPADHPLAEVLSEEGSGIIVSGPSGVILSGPMTSHVQVKTPQAPGGQWTFTGESDLGLARDRLAYPSPAVEDAGAQTATNDVRTGPRETLLHAFVDANLGPSAPGARRDPRMSLGANLGRGGTITASPRFQNLLELLQEIVLGSDVQFDVQQVDDELVFVTSVSDDARGLVRLDLDNEQLASVASGLAAPSVTDAVVAGQGTGTERMIRTASAGPSGWRRRRERFVDKRQADDPDELQQAADDAIASGGVAARSLRIVPTDRVVARFDTDWRLGSWVTIVLGDSEVPARVNAVTLAVTTTGLFIGVTVGDDVSTDWESGVDAELGNMGSRISSLERNAEGGATMMQIFATVEGLEDWTPPDGALAFVTANNRVYARAGGAWVPVVPPEESLDLAPLIVAGAPSGTPTAYRQGDWVQLDGGVLNEDNEIGYNTATTVLTLPSGWRPGKQVDFPSMMFAAGSVWDARIRLNTDGTLVVRIQRDGSSTNTVSRITFGAVRFRTS